MGAGIWAMAPEIMAGVGAAVPGWKPRLAGRLVTPTISGCAFIARVSKSAIRPSTSGEATSGAVTTNSIGVLLPVASRTWPIATRPGASAGSDNTCRGPGTRVPLAVAPAEQTSSLGEGQPSDVAEHVEQQGLDLVVGVAVQTRAMPDVVPEQRIPHGDC